MPLLCHYYEVLWIPDAETGNDMEWLRGYSST
jgi:hypothetical protein